MASQLTLYLSPGDATSQRLMREAGAAGLLRGVTVRSLGSAQSRQWLEQQVGRVVSPVVLLVQSPAARLVSTIPQIVAELRAFAGHGQAPATQAIAYVSRGCGACQQFLSLLASSPTALAKIDVRAIEDSEQTRLEMHEAGAYMTPALVVFGPNGRQLYQGPSASQAVVSMM